MSDVSQFSSYTFESLIGYAHQAKVITDEEVKEYLMRKGFGGQAKSAQLNKPDRGL